jgi:hypothetical protein
MATGAETRGRAARLPPRRVAINAAVRSRAGPGWPGRDPVGVLGPGLRKLWRPGRRARTIVSQPIGGLDRRFGFRRRTVPSGRPEVRETPLRPASPAHSRDPAGAPGAPRRPARRRHPRRAGLGRGRSTCRRSSVHQDGGRVDHRQRRPDRPLDRGKPGAVLRRGLLPADRVGRSRG